MATLRLVPVSGPAIDVVKDQSMVGRDPSCEVVVTDGSVSRRHARLEKRAGAWWVVDQGSANGTYVNSLKVAEQALKNSQELRFGALAFRVDIHEDPEATVSSPILADDSATVMAPQTPPPVPLPPPLPPSPKPAAPPPLPHAAATPPPAPPSAAGARERFRPTGPVAPVPQMPAGAPPAKKGKGPIFWVAVGCCGCLLLVALLAGVIGGGVYMGTKGAADAAHAWLVHVRNGETAEVAAGMTEDYQHAAHRRGGPGGHERDRAVEGRDLPAALRGQRPRHPHRGADRRRLDAADRGQDAEGRRVLEGGRRDARGRVSGPPAFPEPIEIRHEQKARRVVVTWDDGHSSVFPLDYLRSWCPCASCQGHAPTAKYLDLESQELVHVDGVGNYAIALTWADGHNTGIYSFKLLRHLCPCDACGGEKR